jgi:hypothetical protein
MNFFVQLNVLLWKNFTLRKRNTFRVLFEVLWPLSIFLIFFFLRVQKDFSEKVSNCRYSSFKYAFINLKYFLIKGYFPERPLPSSGILPFLRAFICELNHSCYQTQVDDNYDKDFLNRINSLFSMNVNILQDLSDIKIPLMLDYESHLSVPRLFNIDYQELLLQESFYKKYESTNRFIAHSLEKQVDDLLTSQANLNLTFVKHKICHTKYANKPFLREFCNSNSMGIDKVLSALTNEEHEQALFVLRLLMFQKKLIEVLNLLLFHISLVFKLFLLKEINYY